MGGTQELFAAPPGNFRFSVHQDFITGVDNINWKTVAVLVGITTLLGTSTKALAQNDQTYVIGVGAGIHIFSTTDDIRANTLFAEDVAGMTEIFGEWYALDEIGFGLRLIHFEITETLFVVGATAEADIEVNSLIFTLNWVPLGASGYTRLGLMAGIGPSQYKVTLTDLSGNTNSGSTTGAAALAGIYVDWGGEGFGARFGGNYLSANLGDINGASVDASGTTIYFDLRWAF